MADAGEGDPILLLHGFPTSSHLYRNILPTLAKTHRAIALDLPGYGLSDKPLDSLDISTTNLVVHDLGGPVGMYWAVHNPHRVKTMARIQGSHPGAELTALPNCGHFLQEDDPERVAELIAGFFNSNPKTRRKQQAAPTPS